MRRSTVIAVLSGATFAVASVLSGDGLARAADLPDSASPPQRSARTVRVSIDSDAQAPLVRVDLEDPAHLDVQPLPVMTPVPRRSVRLDLVEPETPVAVLAPTPCRVVRVTLDGLDGSGPNAAKLNDLAPRVFHADLEDAQTFTASPSGPSSPVRLVRSDL